MARYSNPGKAPASFLSPVLSRDYLLTSDLHSLRRFEVHHPRPLSIPDAQSATVKILTLPPSLVGSGHLDKAAIISAAGDSAWSSTAGFSLKPEEMKHIADILDNAGGAVDRAYAEGLFVGGVRYVLTKVEGRSLYARQVCYRPNPYRSNN